MGSRTLALILGDQLDTSYPKHLGLDKDTDTIVMIEAAGESKRPLSHTQRTVLFLSAMRHHAQALRDDGWDVRYTNLTEKDNSQSLPKELTKRIKSLEPDRVVCIEPGSHTLAAELEKACDDAHTQLETTEDPHFFCTHERFNTWADGRKELTMEYFYREQRRELGHLVDDDGNPEGGEWNYDKQNRKTFKSAPDAPDPTNYSTDEITEQVIEDVNEVLPGLPGSADGFNWPVTRRQALSGLNAFIKHRLPDFGDYQDAIWTNEPTLYHALISPALNLKLLNPREVCDKAIAAYESGDAPINAVEGFVRQLIGWREFIRGVYFHQGPDYERRNALEHDGQLPEFYWDADTDMACMADALSGVLDLAYAHHISRLMITGNFALIAGVDPKAVNDWYTGMYADGVDWVTTPNTLGMALHADGGVVGTKPYAASANYINKMSNACKSCRYDPKKRTGDDACPFNTFYWDFLIRHKGRFASNRRMGLVLKNVEKLSKDEKTQITVSAKKRREQFGITP